VSLDVKKMEKEEFKEKWKGLIVERSI